MELDGATTLFTALCSLGYVGWDCRSSTVYGHQAVQCENRMVDYMSHWYEPVGSSYVLSSALRCSRQVMIFLAPCSPIVFHDQKAYSAFQS